jgi:hypothetical protein
MNPDALAAIFDKLLLGLAKGWRCQFPEAGKVLSIADESACDSWLRQLFAHPGEIPPLAPALRPWILVRILTAIGALKKMSIDGETLPAVATAALAEYFLLSAWHSDLKYRWRSLASDCRFGEN